MSSCRVLSYTCDRCCVIFAALRTGYVAIIGKPNAGKSTLLNNLLGQKLSAVTRKAQTTRHRILGIESGDDYQMILLDTPGVIKVSDVAIATLTFA